jgi:hypothetical protein
MVPGVAGVTIPPELLDQQVKGPMTAEEVQAICLGFKKALIERAMGGELSFFAGPVLEHVVARRVTRRSRTERFTEL